MAPVTTPIGNWMVKIQATNNSETSEYEHYDGLFILLNPWCCTDSVYMPEEQLLDEYVISDVGKIWTGAERQCKGRHWVFGQFDKCVLYATLFMLDRAGLSHSELVLL